LKYGVCAISNGMNKYLSAYINFLTKNLKPVRPLKIILDCSNGAVGPIAHKVFKNKKFLNFKIINSAPNGNFPAHGPDPLKKDAFKKLKTVVLKEKADLGVIFDADGDRAFLSDNRGRKTNPDAIARLLIWHLKPKKVVVDARTGWLVHQFKIENLKFKIFPSKVGRYFVQKLMKENNADFGAERSGHYYFKKFYFFDSGIFAATQAINAVSKLPYSLADFVDLLPQYYSSETNFKLNAKYDYSAILRKIEDRYKNFAVATSRLDGLKMEIKKPSGGFWFNIRLSNTEPVIRLTIEAQSPKILATEGRNLVNLLKKHEKRRPF